MKFLRIFHNVVMCAEHLSEEDMVKSLKEIIITLGSKSPEKRSRNKSAFLAYWPQIKELQEENWPLTKICEALRIAGVNFKYSVFWKYVSQQREREAAVAARLTPEEKQGEMALVQKPNRVKRQRVNEVQSVEMPTVIPVEDYDQPPQFGRPAFRDGIEKF